jgi:hypothetical protein
MLVAMVSMVVSSTAFALGDEKLTSMYWSVAVPEGDMTEFIDKTSLRGFGLQGRWFVQPALSVGLVWEWQVFDQETSDPIQTTLGENSMNATISGKQFRYINAFPFLATGHLYLGTQGATRLFIGGGVGAFYMMERLEIGLMPVGDMYGHQHLIISAKYNYVVGDDTRFDLTWWELNLGLTWNPEF